MANFIQIPNLPAAVALSGTEQFEAVQAGVSTRVTADQLAALAVATVASGGALTISVPNVVALKELVSRPLVVTTTGYFSPNDGGGGPPWVWVSGSTVAADDFLVVNPSNGAPGRYIRMIPYGGTVSPKWAGAGLGGSDDTVRMNVALAAAGSHAVDISGCTIPGTAFLVDGAVSCPGIFSDGSGTITTASGTTSGTFLFQVKKSDFYVSRVFFDGPISTTPSSPPACATLLSFETPTVAAESDRQSVTNCRFRGASNQLQFRNAINSNAFGRVENNTFTDSWADASVVYVPRNFIFCNNMAYHCGYDPAQTDSVHHFTTEFSTALAENLIVTGNVVRDCCIGFAQEAMDQYGHNIRNAIYANNIIDNVGNGGWEFKSDPFAGAGGFYGDVLIEGNIVSFPQGGGGIGVALNGNNTGGPVANHKFKRFKISGNQFNGIGTGAITASGVNVGPYDNVDISNNQFANISKAVYISPAYSVSETATRVSIRGNDIDVLGDAISTDGSRTITGLEIIGNDIRAVGLTVSLAGATVNKLIQTGNYHETTASTYIAGYANVQTGKIESDIFVCSNTGPIIQGTASTNLRIIGCDVIAAAGEAFRVDSGTVLFQDNSCSLVAGAKIINRVGGTVTGINNKRGAATTDPSGVVAAGTLGEIVPNSAPASGGALFWASTTIGTGGGGGTSVFKAVNLA